MSPAADVPAAGAPGGSRTTDQKSGGEANAKSSGPVRRFFVVTLSTLSGALIGGWLGVGAFVSDWAGPWPDSNQWWVAFPLGAVLGATTWLVSRRLAPLPRWAIRVLFMAALLVTEVGRTRARYERAADYQRRILQVVPIGATESEIVALLGPARQSYDSPDDAPGRRGRFDRCDPPRIGKVLVFGPPDTGGTYRELFFDREGRYYCEMQGSLWY